MGGMSVFHWLIVLVVVMLLFGAGRLSDVGKGLGEGIKNFKKGLRDDEDEAPVVVRAKRKPADVSDEEPVIKQLSAGSAKKKKIIQVEIDDDDDEIEVARKVAAKKKAINEGVDGSAEDEPA